MRGGYSENCKRLYRLVLLDLMEKDFSACPLDFGDAGVRHPMGSLAEVPENQEGVRKSSSAGRIVDILAEAGI